MIGEPGGRHTRYPEYLHGMALRASVPFPSATRVPHIGTDGEPAMREITNPNFLMRICEEIHKDGRKHTVLRGRFMGELLRFERWKLKQEAKVNAKK